MGWVTNPPLHTPSNDKEGKMLLEGLSHYNRPLEIKFDEMLKLMDQCEHVDKISYASRHKAKAANGERSSGGGGGAGDDASSSAGGANDGVALKLATNIFPRSPFSLLSGIIPGALWLLLPEVSCSYGWWTMSLAGTKWCGTGDIAETYSDLGSEMAMDRCCRQHDLCPVKIRAYQHKYELNNDSLYTKWVQSDDICRYGMVCSDNISS